MGLRRHMGRPMRMGLHMGRHMGRQRMGLHKGQRRMDRHKRCHRMGLRLVWWKRCRCYRHRRQDSSFQLRELLYVGNSYDYSFKNSFIELLTSGPHQALEVGLGLLDQG
jgi:hypothetical protein